MNDEMLETTLAADCRGTVRDLPRVWEPIAPGRLMVMPEVERYVAC